MSERAGAKWNPATAPEAPRRTPASEALVLPSFTHARRVRAELVAGILRSGRPVPDETFDDIYPDPIIEVSAAHWTPVRVCARVVELLALPPGARLLDAGAGVGKFCVVAAAMMSHVRVCGVERYSALASIARETARRLGVNVDITDGNFSDEDPRRVDAVYLYNPFTETLRLPGLDEMIPADRGACRASADIAAAELFLSRARTGIRVVTYCGFGADMPNGYERLVRETWGGNLLELWEKRTKE